MATVFGSPPFLSHPLTRTHHFASSSPTPPPNPSSQPQTPIPSSQLRTSSSDQLTPPLTVNKQQKPAKPATVETTDWIASTLTRRFGLGAGLAWATFLAIGVISEQIKTRLEVSQEAANIR